jgi:hypothetical protein
VDSLPIARSPPVSKFYSLCIHHHTFPEGGRLPIFRVENIALSTVLRTHYAPPELTLITNESLNLGPQEIEIQIPQIRNP